MPGLVLMAVLFRSAETTAFSLLFDRMEGIISDVLMAPLGAAEMTAAYALAGAISGLVTGGVVLAGAMLAWPMPPAQPWALPVFAALSALMMSLAGMLIGLYCDKWDHLAAAFVFILTPLTFLSGVFAPVDQLPAAVAFDHPLQPDLPRHRRLPLRLPRRRAPAPSILPFPWPSSPARRRSCGHAVVC